MSDDAFSKLHFLSKNCCPLMHFKALDFCTKVATFKLTLQKQIYAPSCKLMIQLILVSTYHNHKTWQITLPHAQLSIPYAVAKCHSQLLKELRMIRLLVKLLGLA